MTDRAPPLKIDRTKCPTCLQKLSEAQLRLFQGMRHSRRCRCAWCRGDIRTALDDLHRTERDRIKQEAKAAAIHAAYAEQTRATRRHLEELEARAAADPFPEKQPAKRSTGT